MWTAVTRAPGPELAPEPQQPEITEPPRAPIEVPQPGINRPEAPEAVIRFAPDEAFDADHWWRDTADAWSVSREWFGLLNAWAGFPVKSEHW